MCWNAAQRCSNHKNLFFFSTFELCFPCILGIRTKKTIHIFFILAFERSVQFQAILTFFFIRFEALGVHISRLLDVTLYYLVGSFQRRIFYFILSYSCKLHNSQQRSSISVFALWITFMALNLSFYHHLSAMNSNMIFSIKYNNRVKLT